MTYFEKTKNIKENKQLPLTPLTILKPFNLSSNNSTMLMKKRLISTNNENINNKIKEVMRKKCEKMCTNIFIDKKIKQNESPLQEKFNKMFNKSSEKNVNFSYEIFNSQNKQNDNPFNNDYLNSDNLQLNENENDEKKINNDFLEKLNSENSNSLSLSSRIENFPNLLKKEDFDLKKEKEIQNKEKIHQIKTSKFSKNNLIHHSNKNTNNERRINFTKNIMPKKY